MTEENFYPQRDEIPTKCENCGTPIATEKWRGKGLSSDSQPHGHKDPRHSFGCYCSIECSKEHNDEGGTVYPKA